jgi:serine protease AprX
MLLALLLGSAAWAVAPAPALAATRAQPILLELAATQPDATVSVIVQKLATDASVESLVARLGGIVTQEIGMINALAVQLPARAIPDLASSTNVRWVSLDASVIKTGCDECISTKKLANTYIKTIGADLLWNSAPFLQGQGVTVAVVDSGIADGADFQDANGMTRVVGAAKINATTDSLQDHYGHGTHVAGIIGGDGDDSRGTYIGVAPKVKFVNVKVGDDQGQTTISDVLAGLQWVYAFKDTYNIRVVNLSLGSSVAESYHTSPLSAAVEILWFNSVVVVVSAGNNGNGAHSEIYPPANDPFVITVGAADDNGTVSTRDDALASYSPYGRTVDGYNKPDLLAPGSNIVSVLASTESDFARNHPDRVITYQGVAPRYYFNVSGTSMAAAVTAGAVALLLQDEPGLTPDQVKYRLMTTARRMQGVQGEGAGMLDIYTAVRANTTASANTRTEVSQLLSTGDEATNMVTWDSVAWNSVAWNSVAWNSVAWNSVAWNSVAWNN